MTESTLGLFFRLIRKKGQSFEDWYIVTDRTWEHPDGPSVILVRLSDSSMKVTDSSNFKERYEEFTPDLEESAAFEMCFPGKLSRWNQNKGSKIVNSD